MPLHNNKNVITLAYLLNRISMITTAITIVSNLEYVDVVF